MRESLNGGDSGIYKEVVVIGNGPSGLSLSYILSGHRPFYSGSPLPDQNLELRLKGLPDNLSLLHCDLLSLAEGVEGRSRSPVATLFDTLQHPGADLGSTDPAALLWAPAPPIDHVVIGRGPPGGVWGGMEPNVLTISLGAWMELPGLSWADIPAEPAESGSSKRARASHVAAYYAEYVRRFRLNRFLKNGVVTSIKHDDENSTNSAPWIVEGFDCRGRPFTYFSKMVVLGTGVTDRANHLGAAGEALPWVYNDLRRMEDRMCELEKGDEVLVVGGGLSAADAIISARFHGLRVLHVFRRFQSLDRVLPVSMYPEYAKVCQMMSAGGDGYPDYTPLPAHRVLSFSPDGRVEVESPGGKRISFSVSLAGVLIGARPDLDFLPASLRQLTEVIDPKSRPLRVHPGTYQVLGAPPGLHALGPLVGDNFVRFIFGGAAAIVSHLLKTR